MNIVEWLLEGDVSIQYATHRYLLQSPESIWGPLRMRIANEGWGKQFLDSRSSNGHWGLHFYQPKWTSTYYTLLDLKHLGIDPNNPACREMVFRTFHECQKEDGSMNLSKYDHPSDIAVSGMVLQYGAYFCPKESSIKNLIDWLLTMQKEDGRYEWEYDSPNSAPHTTLCVLEGLRECVLQGIHHRVEEILAVEKKGIDYLYNHHFFLDHPDRRYLQTTFPYRYRYNVLRGLEYLQSAHEPYDRRMEEALQWLQHKQLEDGRWKLDAMHQGNLHFEQEKVRQPSRIITLKAKLIVGHFLSQDILHSPR